MKKSKEELKTYFETGDKPTEGQYADLIDSYVDSKQEKGDSNRRFVIDEDGEVSVSSEQNIPEYTLSEISDNKLGLLKDGVVVKEIDLAAYIDDTNLSRLVSGDLNKTTGILMVVREDNSSFNIDLSSLTNEVPEKQTLDELFSSDKATVPLNFSGTSSSSSITSNQMRVNGSRSYGFVNSSLIGVEAQDASSQTHIEKNSLVIRENGKNTSLESGSPTKDVKVTLPLESGKLVIESAIPEYTLSEITANKLSLLKDGVIVKEIDLTSYVDDTNLARLVSGTVGTDGMATFKRDDDSTFTVDFSSLLGDVTNKVPYNGAKEDVNLGDNSISVKNVFLNASSTNVIQSKTLTSGNKNVLNIFPNEIRVGNQKTNLTLQGADGVSLYIKGDNSVKRIWHSGISAPVKTIDTNVSQTNTTLNNSFYFNQNPIGTIVVNINEIERYTYVRVSEKEWRKFTMEDISVVSEQILPEYTLSEITGNKLSLLKDGLVVKEVDLTSYVDDTNLARLVSGTVGTDGMATFKRDDDSTFTVDFNNLTQEIVTNSIIDITYEDLVQLIENNKLIENQEYAFNFKNIYKQIDTDIIKQDSPIEKLVVRAKTNKILFPIARSLTYLQDKIEYDVTTSTFDGLDLSNNPVTNISNQGTVLSRIDTELEIETPYDFRTEKFVRYKGKVPDYDSSVSYRRYQLVKDPNDNDAFVRLCHRNAPSSLGNNIDNFTYWQRLPFGGFIVNELIEGYTYTKTKPYLNVVIDVDDYQEFLTFSNAVNPVKSQAYKVKLYNKNIVIKTKACECEIKYIDTHVDGVTLYNCEQAKLRIGQAESRNSGVSGTTIISSIKGLNNKLLNISGYNIIINISDTEFLGGNSTLNNDINGIGHNVHIGYCFINSIQRSMFMGWSFRNPRIVGVIIHRNFSSTVKGVGIENCQFSNNVDNVTFNQAIRGFVTHAEIINVVFNGKISNFKFHPDQSTYVPVNNEGYSQFVDLKNCIFNTNINNFEIIYDKTFRETEVEIHDAIFNTKELTGILKVPFTNAQKIKNPQPRFNYNFNFINYFKKPDDTIELYYQDIDADGTVSYVRFEPELIS